MENKLANLWNDENTLVLTDDELCSVVTALEMMVDLYNRAITLHGENSLSIQEKEVFNEMKVLHEKLKNKHF